MAQKITVGLEGDLDGPADVTIRLRIGGTEYELDLSKKRHRVGRKLALFIEHARRAGQGQPHRPGRTAASRKRSGGIRAWAKDQGIAASGGASPPSIVEQCRAATTGDDQARIGTSRTNPPPRRPWS
jgi:hypothetical protein